jgi:hypothetical protein
VTFGKPTLSSTKFADKTTCTSLAPGASCMAYVTYFPTYAGTNTGRLTMPTAAGSVSVSLSAG